MPYRCHTGAIQRLIGRSGYAKTTTNTERHYDYPASGVTCRSASRPSQFVFLKAMQDIFSVPFLIGVYIPLHVCVCMYVCMGVYVCVCVCVCVCVSHRSKGVRDNSRRFTHISKKKSTTAAVGPFISRPTT